MTTRTHVTRNAASTPWERLAHNAALLGYGQFLSFVTVMFSMWLSSLQWTDGGSDGVARLNNGRVVEGLMAPFMAFYTIATACNIYQSSANLRCGPSNSKFPLLLGLVLMPVFCGILAALLSAGIDCKYLGLDLVVVSVFASIFIGLDITIRKNLSGKRNAGPQEREGHAHGDKQRRRSGCLFVLKSTPLLIISVVIGFLYPFAIIPLFFSSEVKTRAFICLLVHPVLLEATEALGRGSRAGNVARALRAKKFTLKVAEQRITQGSPVTFFIKQLMAFYRRFMLLNMGSADATLIALVVAAIEEALTRGFLVQIDTTIRKLRGLPELTGDELRLQRLVWMCDTNQSCIAEFNAILTSSFVFVLLERHAMIFAIGYKADQAVSTATVFVQLLVELALEIFVDNSTMWAEAEHGIPVTQYFSHANGLAVFGVHAAGSITQLCNALYAFIRYPHFTSCKSSNVCDCLDDETFKPWSGRACTLNTTSTLLNSTASTYHTSDFFDDVDFIAVLIALLAGFATLVLVILSILFARYRQRKQVVVALKAGIAIANQDKRDAEEVNRWLKQALERAQSAVNDAVGENRAELQRFCIKFSEVEFIEEIGVVWKGSFRGSLVAIKTLRVTKVIRRVVEDFMKEIKLMSSLRHKFLVRLFGGCWEDGPDNLCLVLEFCGRGTLKDLLVDQHSGYSWEKPYFAITSGVASCFRYLHHEQPNGGPIIHRDLKSENVMICDDLSPRVGDFGESTRFDQQEVLRRLANREQGDSMLTMTVVGLCHPPRRPSASQCPSPPDNMAADVYSFAITLLEIGCRDHYFVTKQFNGIPKSIQTQSWRPKPKNELVECQPELWGLIQECWVLDPNVRPNFVEICRRIEALAATATVETTLTAGEKAQVAEMEPSGKWINNEGAPCDEVHHSADIANKLHTMQNGAHLQREDELEAKIASLRAELVEERARLSQAKADLFEERTRSESTKKQAGRQGKVELTYKSSVHSFKF